MTVYLTIYIFTLIGQLFFRDDYQFMLSIPRENAPSVSWLRHDYPHLSSRERPYECTIYPGDLLYFPVRATPLPPSRPGPSTL